MVLLTTETASCRLYVTCFPQGKGKPCSEMHMNEWHPGDLLHWGCLVLLLCSPPTFSTLHWPRKIVTICLWLEQELPWAASAVSFAEGGYWADWPFAQWYCWTCFLIRSELIVYPHSVVPPLGKPTIGLTVTKVTKPRPWAWIRSSLSLAVSTKYLCLHCRCYTLWLPETLA